MISRIVGYNKRDLCGTISGCFLPVDFRSSEIGTCFAFRMASATRPLGYFCLQRNVLSSSNLLFLLSASESIVQIRMAILNGMLKSVKPLSNIQYFCVQKTLNLGF